MRNFRFRLLPVAGTSSSTVEQPCGDDNPATLRALVTAPENAMPLEEIDRLAEVIPPGTLTAVREATHELWDTNLALLVLIGLLPAEWALRKKHHLL